MSFAAHSEVRRVRGESQVDWSGSAYMLTLSDTWYLRHLPRTTIMKEGGQMFGRPMADPAFSTDFVEPQANLQSRPTKQTVAQLV